MLHKIDLPACTQHLEWVVQLQVDLLRAICDVNLGAAGVTLNWVKAQRPDLDVAWAERFCGWLKNGMSILDRMQAVAALPGADKQALLAHYEINLRYPEAFDDAVLPPPATKPLPDGLPDDAAVAYRNFFELFYAPIFYRGKGYPINAADLNGQTFTKDQYLEAYRAVNSNMQVCPLCDGSMDGAEIDHWLAKKKYFPELNCHPLNLVEICGACNSRTNKGEQLALDDAQPNPFDNWFHPYLRPAVGKYTIEIDRGRPKLAGNSDDVKRRIEKLDGLINLSKRWIHKFDNLTTRIQERIRHHRRRGRSFDKNSLIEQIRIWLTEAKSEIGLGEYKLLESALLEEASDDTSDLFTELLKYATEIA